MACDMRAPLLSALLLASTIVPAAGDPIVSRVHFGDVDRFYRVFDAAQGRPSADRLRVDYIDSGSAGVRDFVPYRIESAEALATKIAEDRALYDRARLCRPALPKVAQRMRAAYDSFQAILPDATLPDTTILIGRGNSGGTAKPSGVLIGLEVVCDPTPGAIPLDVRMTHLVAHELAHTQQTFFVGDTLLAASLNEGVAELVAEVISGAPLNAAMFAKADKRAEELERAFAAEMMGADKRGWLYNGAGSEDRPGDLGYWVGYRIAKRFYDRSADKSAAIRTILKSTDAKAFLEASGWTPQRR